MSFEVGDGGSGSRFPLSRRLVLAAVGAAAIAGVATGGAIAAHRSASPHPRLAAQTITHLSPSPTPAALPSPTPHRQVDIGVPHTDVAHAPHFATPQAAMRYLAAAWNANDLADLDHVTDPPARQQLNDMHGEAIRLALDHCTRRAAGDYDRFFTHEFPNDRVRLREDKDGDGIGHAEFLVGPATRPGWYMTIYVQCGG